MDVDAAVFLQDGVGGGQKGAQIVHIGLCAGKGVEIVLHGKNVIPVAQIPCSAYPLLYRIPLIGIEGRIQIDEVSALLVGFHKGLLVRGDVGQTKYPLRVLINLFADKRTIQAATSIAMKTGVNYNSNINLIIRVE